jgi:hypothetical protein
MGKHVMFKPGLIVVCGGMVLALSGCGVFGGVDSVVKNLSKAADLNEGSYRAPLAIPPNYNLRPPAARAAKKTAPAATPASTDKNADKLTTAPATASKKAGTKIETTAKTKKTAKKSPRKLVIAVPDKSKPVAKKVPQKNKKTEARRVPKAPPQPSETTGKVRPETRGKEETDAAPPSKGEDELLRRSGVKE